MESPAKYFVTELVGEVGSLPSVAAQVVSLTADPACDLDSLARLILSDNVLTMRFLALANSAAFARGREVRNLRTALARLGLRRVRHVALLMGMHDMSAPVGPDTGLDMTAYWRHCLAVASCARGLARQRGLPAHEDAWLAGILHGLGVTLLAQRTGERFAAVVDHARRERTTLVDAELRLLDFHHGELGARLLRTWKLPPLLADVVEFHPESFAANEVTPGAAALIAVLRDAIDIVRATGFGDSGDHTPRPRLGDLSARLGLTPPALRALADMVDREVADLAALVGLSPPESTFANALAACRQELARVGLVGFDDSLLKEELEAELAAARSIQQHLLPRSVPLLTGCSLRAVNVPSRSVSGDTYDFLTLPDGSPAFMIADVCGKGTPAALLASTLQASIRALALVFSDPGELLAAANRALYASTDPERFATVFLAVLAPDGRSLRYASAGHDPPVLRRADGRFAWLRPDGMPLGMLPEMAYPVSRVRLERGDVLAAYTDGITEARGPCGDDFAREGLLAAVAATAHAGPAEIIDRIVADVARHVGGGASPAPAAAPPDRGDDLTLVVLKTI